jgi:hypothetical protein
MKYNDTINIVKTIRNAIKDPTVITDMLGITEAFSFPDSPKLNSNTTTDIPSENQSINTEKVKSVSNKTSKYCNDYEEDVYYSKKQTTSSNPQGVIDSIAQDLTSARLQQAIILSEIVGKPRSKARRQRRKF